MFDRLADSDEEIERVNVLEGPFPEDAEAEKAKTVVTEFVHLLEKSKNLFNGLK